MESRLDVLDRAHASFLAQALVILAFAAGCALTVRADETSLVGALYFTPVPFMLAVALGLVFLVATYKGFVLALRAAQRGLPFLPGLSAILLVLLFGEPGHFVLGDEAIASVARLLDQAPPYWAAVHALLCLALAGRWFLIERRRFEAEPARS